MISQKPSFVSLRVAFFAASFGSLCLSATVSAQQTATSTVSIQVTDPTGAPVPHVPIRLVPSPDSAPAKMETDTKGQLSLNLDPGGYALFVEFPGYKAVATFVDVLDAKEVQVVPVRLELAGKDSSGVYTVAVTPKDVLRISASPYHEDMMLTRPELKALPQTTVKVHNARSKTDETYTGVRVADLLAKMNAPLGQKLHGLALSAFLVATGSDGYAAVLALAEADPTFHSGEVIVAYRLNGKPLDAKSGPFKLIVTDDKRQARWIPNLVSIELKSAM